MYFSMAGVSANLIAAFINSNVEYLFTKSKTLFYVIFIIKRYTKNFYRILEESMGYNYYYRAGKLSVRREPYKS